MKTIYFLLLFFTLLSCNNSFDNPPFVVMQIGSDVIKIKDKCCYVSFENNIYVDDCNKYQIGDTIYNAPNFIK